MSDNVVCLRTPTGGRARIEVGKLTSGGIELRLERHLGDPHDPTVKSETIVGMSANHARWVARQILMLLGEPV